MSEFNPITSSKTKLQAKLENGWRIYSHTRKDVAGDWIITDATGLNWTACRTFLGALSTTPGESAHE